MIDVNDPFFEKIFMHLVRMAAEDFQKRAETMSAEELYENSDFFPAYNPDRHDYMQKPVGYTCRAEDGTIMQLMPSIATMALSDDTSGMGKSRAVAQPMWKRRWSRVAEYAKAFVSDPMSPYDTGMCCVWENAVYRSLEDDVIESPAEAETSWELIHGVELT